MSGRVPHMVCAVTMKLIPVRIEEKPTIMIPIAVGTTLVTDESVLYGV